MPYQKVECKKCDSVRVILRKNATDAGASFYCETCRATRKPARWSRRFREYIHPVFHREPKLYTPEEWSALAPEAQKEVLPK